MRILATTSPLMSHLRPMLPLLRAARAAGHDVVVATGPDLAREVQRRGYRTWPIGPVAADVLAPRSAQAPAGNSAAHLRHSASTMFGQPGAARARALLARASRWAPDWSSRPLSPSYPAPPTSSPAWRCRSPPEATPA